MQINWTMNESRRATQISWRDWAKHRYHTTQMWPSRVCSMRRRGVLRSGRWFCRIRICRIWGGIGTGQRYRRDLLILQIGSPHIKWKIARKRQFRAKEYITSNKIHRLCSKMVDRLQMHHICLSRVINWTRNSILKNWSLSILKYWGKRKKVQLTIKVRISQVIQFLHLSQVSSIERVMHSPRISWWALQISQLIILRGRARLFQKCGFIKRVKFVENLIFLLTMLALSMEHSSMSHFPISLWRSL